MAFKIPKQLSLWPKPPRFEHDCDTCTFLGWCGRFDVWGCLVRRHAMVIDRYCSIIARYSSEPSGYASMSIDVLRSAQGDLTDRHGRDSWAPASALLWGLAEVDRLLGKL